MKDYLLFNACMKKSSWRHALLFTCQNLKKREMAIAALLFTLGVVFMSLKYWKEFDFVKDIFSFFGLEVKFTLLKEWSVKGVLRSNILMLFALGEILILFFGIYLYWCLQRRVILAMEIFDSRVRGTLFKYRFIKFLMFIKKCDDFKILNDWQIKSAIDCCDRELFSNSYSNVSSNPVFIVFVAFSSAFLSLYINYHGHPS